MKAVLPVGSPSRKPGSRWWGWFRGPPQVGWFEPYWSHISRTWREFRLVFAPGSICRVLVVTAASGALVLAGLRLAFPQFQLQPQQWLPIALIAPGFYVYLGAVTAIHLAIPRIVRVRKDQLTTQAGQSVQRVLAAEVTKSWITFFPGDRVRLRVSYVRSGRRRVLVAGVTNKVNLEQLAAQLPVIPVIRDGRRRTIRTRRPASAGA